MLFILEGSRRESQHHEILLSRWLPRGHRGMVYNPGCHPGGIPQWLWLGVGPQPGILGILSVFFYFQQCNPTCTDSKMWWEPGMWAQVSILTPQVSPGSHLLGQQGTSKDSALRPAFA